jgi:hypothetical protein
VVSFTPQPLYPCENSPRYALCLSLGGPYSPARLYGEGKNPLSLTEIELRLNYPCLLARNIKTSEVWTDAKSEVRMYLPSTTHTSPLLLPKFKLCIRKRLIYSMSRSPILPSSKLFSSVRIHQADVNFLTLEHDVCFLFSHTPTISVTEQLLPTHHRINTASVYRLPSSDRSTTRLRFTYAILLHLQT